jgi:hypothetical protein
VTTIASQLGPPPAAPGSLTAPAPSKQVLTYLDALNRWTAELKRVLDAIDASAQVARDPGAYTNDIVLAMTLWNSIEGRRLELVAAWDSGRVLKDELAHIATLLWGRLADPLGAPSAFTLPEACTLVAALCDRLDAMIARDAVAGSGAADRIEPLRAALERCRRQAGALGRSTDRIDALAAELEAAIARSAPEAIATAVARIDAEVALLERDLIKEAGARAGAGAQATELRRRYDELSAKQQEIAELAARCREKIADAPNLAVPSLAALGEPPNAPANVSAAEWETLREQFAEYAAKLGRVTAAFAEAATRFGAPLQERDDLRGLLGSYRHRASANGLAEDAALEDKYQAAHTVLWSAPCDLRQARALVAEYQRAVRVAVGADTSAEPSSSASLTPRERP